jgi:ABC-type branched-subunit amino acid transport system substrate-binding protein
VTPGHLAGHAAADVEGERRAVKIGVLAPLSRPGWVEAGQHLLAGLQLARDEVNDRGGVDGRLLDVLLRDTAADPQKAARAMEELAHAGVVAVGGEYHSVVARAAAATAHALELPFLCSSAVLDALTDEATDWVARLAPPQTRGWRIYAEFLHRAGHSRVGVALGPGIYWESGTRILRDHLTSAGGSVVEFDVDLLQRSDLADQVVVSGVSALLVLVGHPEPAVSVVEAVRDDSRLDHLLIGAPAGQAELGEWVDRLGARGHDVPFLRYMPDALTGPGPRVASELRDRLGVEPSFVAFEGYDTMMVLAEVVRVMGSARGDDAAPLWSRIAVEGTRGPIAFSRVPGVSVWQWARPPIQVAQLRPGGRERLQVLHSG